MKALLTAVLGFLVLSGSSFAAIQVRFQKAASNAEFQLGTGSAITIEFPGHNEPRPGLFLGQVLKISGDIAYYMVLDIKTQNVLYIPQAFIEISGSGMQLLMDPTPQQGGTCTGYAIDDFMVQSHFSGLKGNGELTRTLSTEEGRAGLLVDSINQYYLVTQHRLSIVGILNQYGKKFGFQCQDKKFATSKDALAYLEKELVSGRPVLLSFYLGPTMKTSPFEFVSVGPSSFMKQDQRIWAPRKVGERNSGGHSILAASAFMFNGRLELVTIDSDWDQPRIWDAEDYLDDRTAISEIDFISCH